MKKSNFREAQIVFILKQAEDGTVKSQTEYRSRACQKLLRRRSAPMPDIDANLPVPRFGFPVRWSKVPCSLEQGI